MSQASGAPGAGMGVMKTNIEAMWREATSEANEGTARAVAAINVLVEWIKKSEATTMIDLLIQLKTAAEHIEKLAPDVIALPHSCELFLRYVTRSNTEIPDFEECKASLVARSASYKEMTLKTQKKIADLSDPFVRDGSVVLLHGFSRVVQRVLQRAGERGKRFSVLVTESQPGGEGYKTAEVLIGLGISVKVLPDAAVGFAMEKVDSVLVGAEAVVENGGIINKVGTYTIALVAKAQNKPLYVAAESYKFSRIYPLHQADVPNPEGGGAAYPVPPISPRKSAATGALVSNPSYGRPRIDGEVPAPIAELQALGLPGQVESLSPMRDFTPPEFITLLFTDLGVLTPSAVSDELIKLYY